MWVMLHYSLTQSLCRSVPVRIIQLEVSSLGNLNKNSLRDTQLNTAESSNVIHLIHADQMSLVLNDQFSRVCYFFHFVFGCTTPWTPRRVPIMCSLCAYYKSLLLLLVVVWSELESSALDHKCQDQDVNQHSADQNVSRPGLEPNSTD